MVTVEVRTVEGYNLALFQWFHCIVPSLSFYDMSDSKLQYCSNVSWQSQLETRFSILGSFRESRIEARVSSFDFWGSRTKFRGSSFETLEEFFEDLEQRFWGNDLILENKTIAMNKAIGARLYSRKLTRCWMYANFFCVVHFLQDTCGSFIYTEADDSKLA